MPMHDWKKVDSWVYHDFHTSLIVEIRRGLNPLLPSDYYAMAEQSAGPMGPDILTLKHHGTNGSTHSGGHAGTAVATKTKPRVTFTETLETELDGFKQKRIGIHHASGDELVAIIEIVSPGNKGSLFEFQRFVRKAVTAIEAGIHVLIVDPFPPTPRDPQGIHAAIWKKLGGRPFKLPARKRLTCVAYESAERPRCYVEPYAVGQPLPEMPLFLKPDRYINVPFEKFYANAWPDVLPQHRALLED